MARKLIAFLGIQARATRYDFGKGRLYEGEVFPEALMRFLERHGRGFDQALFLVTEDARRKTWPLLEQKGDPRLKSVPIADGRTDLEMWSWMEALLPYIQHRDALIFDITHGLRSAPFLVFLFTAYLRQVRRVSIEGIYYGAYDLARGGPAPVIDLSAFVRLLDWLTATAFFERLGDARYLARVLREVATRREMGYLKHAAEDLERLSLALMLTRPMEVMEQAHRWARTLERIREDTTPALKPFHEMAAQLQREYAGRALEEPKAQPQEALRQQYELIAWYVSNNQILQAATLAVEWLVSLAAWLVEGRLVLRRGDREEWSRALHSITRYRTGRAEQEDLSEKALRLLDAHAEFCQDVAQIWDRVTHLRNDLNHAGMSENASKAHRLAQKMRDLMPKLEHMVRYLVPPGTITGGNQRPKSG